MYFAVWNTLPNNVKSFSIITTCKLLVGPIYGVIVKRKTYDFIYLLCNAVKGTSLSNILLFLHTNYNN